MNTPIHPGYARGFPQGPQRNPATPRRGHPAAAAAAAAVAPAMPVAMPQHAVNVPPYMAAQRNSVAHPSEAAIRRSRKPTDKNLPDGVEDVVIGEGAQQYKNMRELEKRLDAAVVRKRLDIQDSISKTVKKYRTMRIWISNTVENQPWQNDAAEGDGASPGSGRYKVKIEGRLLDDPSESTELEGTGDGDENMKSEDGTNDAAAAAKKMNTDDDDSNNNENKSGNDNKPFSRQQRFSQFFRTVTIDFDKPSMSRPEEFKSIVWNKPPLPPNTISPLSNADFDSLQFTRSSQENLNVTINLVRDETPERYKLSKELADVLDVDEEDRSGIVLGIWDYIRAMELQGDEEKRLIRCDQRLRSIFGREQMFFPQIPESIGPHTSPLDPIKLPYTIRVDEEFQKNNKPTPTIYDIRVAVEDPLRTKMLALTQNPQYAAGLRHIALLDDQLALIMQTLTHSRAKHAFYSALAKDPATFVRRWVNSQRRDLETILGEATKGGGEDGNGPEFRRGGQDGAWDTPVAREAVRYMLAKPEAASAR